MTVIRPSGIVIPGTKRPPNEGTGGPNKRLKPPGDDEEGLQFRCRTVGRICRAGQQAHSRCPAFV